VTEVGEHRRTANFGIMAMNRRVVQNWVVAGLSSSAPARLCIHLRTYVCMCVCMCVCTRVCVCVYMYVFFYIFIGMLHYINN
jgi:hypothetical protein